jgi:hypothetical protein
LSLSITHRFRFSVLFPQHQLKITDPEMTAAPMGFFGVRLGLV